MFKQNPEALVLWAHSGFEQVDKVRAMVTKHKTLWADVAFRTDHAPSGKLDATWRQLFVDFPDRFMVGTDTYTPERWHYVVEHANYSRKWLNELPADLADNIAFRNAERLAALTHGAMTAASALDASLSPRGRGCEAMTYGRVHFAQDRRVLDGAAISHLAELARGDFFARKEGPLIRPVSPEASLRLDGPPSPQGEKGPRGLLWRISSATLILVLSLLALHTHGATACAVPEGFARLARRRPRSPIAGSPATLKVGQFFAAEVIACRAPGAGACARSSSTRRCQRTATA